MPVQIPWITTKKDAEKLSTIILASLDSPHVPFNPYHNKLFKHVDGTIRFMGKVLTYETALNEIAKQVCKDKKRINREIKRWQMFGPHVVNCGC